MDLKFYKKRIPLHLVDHATRLSASTVIASKDPEVAIFKSWIQVYGSAEKFMSDNGGELANKKFIGMCESMNIRFMLTEVESPFSNGLGERHNLILSEMLDKTLEDHNTDFELALAWCVNTKNSLANVHGFSPSQFALGQNRKLRSIFHDKPSALSPINTRKILTDNLLLVHKTRQAYIASKSSEKMRRTLNHNVRTRKSVRSRWSAGTGQIRK